MYAYLKGVLIESHPSHIILDVNGVGYYLSIPCRLLGELPELGQQVLFYTSFVVRELSQDLYGFLSSEERDLFEILMNISGIGPKLALSLIGHLNFDDLSTAVGGHDLPTLCRVPGVGRKTAERLVVELKDKLPRLTPQQFSNYSISIPKSKQQRVQDAMLALINLGYQQGAAQKALKEALQDLPEEAELPLMITTALKKI